MNFIVLALNIAFAVYQIGAIMQFVLIYLMCQVVMDVRLHTPSKKVLHTYVDKHSALSMNQTNMRNTITALLMRGVFSGVAGVAASTPKILKSWALPP